MKNFVLATIALQVGCTQPAFYAGPEPLPSVDTTICSGYTGTTTVTWPDSAARAGLRLGISKDGQAPFVPVVDETQVPSGYYYQVIGAQGQTFDLQPPKCTEAYIRVLVPECERGTVRVVDEAGRGLADMTVASVEHSYYRYGGTDDSGRITACFFRGGRTRVHGPGYLLDRREGQIFRMRPAKHPLVRVVDEAGDALPGAQVRVSALGATWDQYLFRANQEGVIRLEVDPQRARRARFDFSHPGYATTRVSGLDGLGATVTLRSARIVRVQTPALLGRKRDLSCGTLERDKVYTCREHPDSWVCECPLGPANVFVDYHGFAIAPGATAVRLDLSRARNGIRGRLRDWHKGCDLRSRRDGSTVDVAVAEQGTFSHPLLAPSLKHWLELECDGETRVIEHDRLSWRWLDLGEI